MTSRLTLLAAFALAVAAFAITHYTPIPYGLKELAAMGGGEKILDLAPAFTSDAVHARLEAFGEEGRAVYRRFAVTTDVAFPLALLAFLFVFARFGGARASLPRAARGFVLAVPVLWFATDMIENLTIFTLIGQFPARNDMLASNLGYVTLAKRALLMASLALPLLLLLWTMLRRGRAGRGVAAD